MEINAQMVVFKMTIKQMKMGNLNVLLVFYHASHVQIDKYVQNVMLEENIHSCKEKLV